MNRVGAVPSQPAVAMGSSTRIPVKCEQRTAGKEHILEKVLDRRQARATSRHAVND